PAQARTSTGGGIRTGFRLTFACYFLSFVSSKAFSRQRFSLGVTVSFVLSGGRPDDRSRSLRRLSTPACLTRAPPVPGPASTAWFRRIALAGPVGRTPPTGVGAGWGPGPAAGFARPAPGGPWRRGPTRLAPTRTGAG